MNRDNSNKLWEDAQEVIAGGVNSPVRAFKAVGGNPVFIDHGSGSKIFDVDGNKYIDYVLSWGPLILGHSHPEVIQTIKKTTEKGTSFGAPTQAETELANLIIDAFPSIEKLRLVNSGTEADMSAIRVARGYTKRDLIIKFEGCYHGHSDGLLVKAGSGLATFCVPDSAGVPESFAAQTIILPYNDIDAFKRCVNENQEKIACVIIEPIAGNMGTIEPDKEFLNTLRELTKERGIVFIFDEVITGFRAAYGGAQSLYNIKPDMTVLGKIIGGGLPVGAFGGKKEIMDCLAPIGGVYQAGTLSGNPIAVNAGLASLSILRDNPDIYKQLEEKAKKLVKGLKQAAQDAKIPVETVSIGSMMCMFFTDKPVRNYTEAVSCDSQRYSKYFNYMLDEGIYLPPSQFETFFLSTAHTDEDIETTISAASKIMKKI